VGGTASKTERAQTPGASKTVAQLAHSLHRFEFEKKRFRTLLASLPPPPACRRQARPSYVVVLRARTGLIELDPVQPRTRRDQAGCGRASASAHEAVPGPRPSKPLPGPTWRFRMIVPLRMWVGRASRVTRTWTRTRLRKGGTNRSDASQAGSSRTAASCARCGSLLACSFPPSTTTSCHHLHHFLLAAAAYLGLRAPTATESGSCHPVPFAASATRRRHRVKTARSAASPTRRFVSGHTLLRICAAAAALQRLSFMDSVGAST
jgi:hypothetical protein